MLYGFKSIYYNKGIYYYVYEAAKLFKGRHKQETASLSLLVFIIKVLLPLTVGRFSTDLLVILLEGSKILTSFREFSFLHSFAHIL